MFEHNVSNIQTQCALLYMKSAMKNLLYIYTFGNMGNAYTVYARIEAPLE